MEFRILGPLEVLEANRPIPVGGTSQASLLVLLLLHANEVVTADRLIDELWPGESPASGAAALQTRVSRLRKALGANAPALETRGPGYVIRPAAEQVDLHRFERLVDEAAGSDPATAAEKLRAALALWRGPALADFAYASFAQAAIRRLEELRLLALERRIDAELELGRHAALVPELESLVADHPLREGLWAQLMLALYRAGRQAEALDVYQRGRNALVDELGIEPGLALQELERAILRHDQSLELAPAVRAILAAGLRGRPLDPLIAVAEPLARKPRREVIIARLLDDSGDLGSAVATTAAHCEYLAALGVPARAAAFTAVSPGADTARLASEQNVDLILVAAPTDLLNDADLAELLRAAPCDVAVLVGDAAQSGPVLVPFAGAAHDWTAIELGAWLAGSWRTPLRLAGPAANGGRDSSRLLASASLAVQRALGVVAEPLLVEPGPDALVAAAREASIAVAGLSDRWRTEGLGRTRSALAASGRPALLVRGGLRPGGLAPAKDLTRFTWSLRVG